MWSYSYDLADQLLTAVERSTDPTPVVLKRYGYTFDAAGNRLTEQIDDVAKVSTFDQLNRITSQLPGGALRVAGALNEAATLTIQGRPTPVTSDNRFIGAMPTTTGTNTLTIAATDPSGNATSQQYEVDITGSGRTFSYDANGNATVDGTRTYEWDARNQLTAIVVGAHRSEFTYDGLRRRTRIVEKDNGVVQNDTRLFWCQAAICEERAADGMTVLRRRYAQGEQVAGAATFFALDHLGSVRDVTDGSATVLARYTFEPWGKRTQASGTAMTPVGFATQRQLTAVDLSLTYFRGYDPELGRWLSEDPIGWRGGKNFYAYTGNNPVRYIDFLGLCGCTTVKSYEVYLACIAYNAGQPEHVEVQVLCALLFTEGFVPGLVCEVVVAHHYRRKCHACATYCAETGPDPACFETGPSEAGEGPRAPGPPGPTPRPPGSRGNRGRR
jgi:RHS repeat-associated protein